MQAYRLIIQPETAFGTPLVGDTLFGQNCWGIVEQYGETRLEQCLQGYTDKRPFLIVSDALPKDHLPLPTLPSAYWQQDAETDRKKLKKRQWLPETALAESSRRWQMQAKNNHELAPHLSAATASRTTASTAKPTPPAQVGSLSRMKASKSGMPQSMTGRFTCCWTKAV